MLHSGAIMPSDAAALVLVLPEDSADTVIAKLRATGALSVQLLVSEGAVAMRRPEVAARIYDLATAEGIDLMLISSDQPTVAAAQQGGIPTLLVDDARVLAPGRSNRTDRPASPYSTRVIERQPPPAYKPAPKAPLARPVTPADEDLYALEGIAAALNDRAPPAPPARSDAELLAASLGRELAPAPPPAQPRRAPPPAQPRRAPPPSPSPLPTAAAAAPRRRAWQIFALIGGLLVLLLVIGGVLFLNSGVTVTVAAPLRPDAVKPFVALPVPLVAAGAGVGGSAVEAEALGSDVAVSQTGEVTESTLTPSSSASGVVNLLNSSAQALLLPAGSEFIAVKADGQEVPFVSNVDVLVPGATTSDQGAQIVTTRGQAEVPVTAKSPGSASNVEANTVRRIVPPGGQGFNTDTGSLRVSNPPISGGSEQEVRIVKDSDAQALLAPALEQLDAEARRQLEGLAQQRGLSVDASTILPRRADLEQLQGFEYKVDPPAGTTLDAANPRFVLTAQARYSALATPAGKGLREQLGPAVTEQLRQSGELQPGDCRAPAVTGWRWDGESLLVDGQITPDTQSPRCQGGLDAEALAQVREAVRGKSREQADAALQALQAQGVIGDYSLPEGVRQLPRFDWQLSIQGR